MSGVIELFAYWFISDCLKLFHFEPNQKILNTFTIALFFFFVFFVFSFTLLAKFMYRKQSSYFLENNHPNLKGVSNFLF